MRVFRSALLLLSLVTLAIPVARAASPGPVPLPANFLGLTFLELGPDGPDEELTDIVNDRWHHVNAGAAVKPATQSSSAAAVAATTASQSAPVVSGQRVQGAGEGTSGFNGLSHFDQRYAGSGAYLNTQFSLEPPDQGMCAGNGYVVETINNALAVYDRRGNVLAGPLALSQFYKLAPEVVRTTPSVYGQFISDPRCHYDAGSGRWFVTELEIDRDPATGADGAHSSIILAVSTSSDPTGGWYLYSFDTTSGDGTLPGHAACPCFGDQPLIGVDANGVYISTNEFPISAAGFNGAQLYALSKSALVAGRPLKVWSFNIGGSVPVPPADQANGGIWYTVAPSVTVGPAANANVEYFLSTLQFGPSPYDNRLAVWALTGTNTLRGEEPELHLLHTLVTTESYGMDPTSSFAAPQKPGPTPLRDALGGTDALSLLNANDDRMNPIIVSQGGNLWGGLNTNVSVGGQVRQGIAWFSVTPSLSGGHLSATVHSQGYAAVAGEDVMFPSIAVNAQGRAVLAFTLAGPDNWPSAAYLPLGGSGSSIRVAKAGVGPADGFTGYAAYGGNGVQRWGDYSAAVADEHGDLWLANEYVGQTCTDDQFAADTTCGGTRSLLANWGTYITHISNDN